MKKTKILAIDDDRTFLESLQRVLENDEYSFEGLSVSNDTLSIISKKEFDIILLDMKMPGIDGIEVLKNIIQYSPYLPVIVISGQSNIKTAVEAMKFGAYDFIEKPPDIQRLKTIIKNAILKRDLVETKERLIGEIEEAYRMVGESQALAGVCQDISKFSKGNSKVLITGESGTGKELVARALHSVGTRRGKPFIKINCAAIPNELLESELFGYVKGAFTGAVKNKPGKFEAAEEGTIFLDEIAELDKRLQAKLLRVLEENEIEVLGETKLRKINVKVISATNKELGLRVEQGLFREDLFHRLNVFRIHIPPLRDREEDIIPLANHFIARFNNEYNKQIKSISNRAASVLIGYHWPGNVRELRNVVENIVVFNNSARVELEDVLFSLSKVNQDNHDFSKRFESLSIARDTFEKEYILKILIANSWHMNDSAKELGIDRINLYRRMQRLGIKKDSSE